MQHLVGQPEKAACAAIADHSAVRVDSATFACDGVLVEFYCLEGRILRSEYDTEYDERRIDRVDGNDLKDFMICHHLLQFAKDGSYGDAGDKVMSLSRAVGAKWICSPRTETGKIDDTWDRVKWNWYNITDGRNAYRSMVDRLVREEQTKVVASAAAAGAPETAAA